MLTTGLKKYQSCSKEPPEPAGCKLKRVIDMQP